MDLYNHQPGCPWSSCCRFFPGLLMGKLWFPCRPRTVEIWVGGECHPLGTCNVRSNARWIGSVTIFRWIQLEIARPSRPVLPWNLAVQPSSSMLCVRRAIWSWPRIMTAHSFWERSYMGIRFWSTTATTHSGTTWNTAKTWACLSTPHIPRPLAMPCQLTLPRFWHRLGWLPWLNCSGRLGPLRTVPWVPSWQGSALTWFRCPRRCANTCASSGKVTGDSGWRLRRGMAGGMMSQ